MFTKQQVPDEIIKLAQKFQDAGYELYLVGGSVRDIFLQRNSEDYDFTTNALPDDTERILRDWANVVFDVGKKFGTIAGIKYANNRVDEQANDDKDVKVEITTFRADEYDGKTRKPVVSFGDNIADDLCRRDFTVNAMALRLPNVEFVDLHNGLSDLNAKVLRTPIEPDISFADDPLRMMRAVRFVSTLKGYEIERETYDSIVKNAGQIQKVSNERVRDELEKLLLGADPVQGIKMFVNTGLSAYVLPELPALMLTTDPQHHHKDVYAHSLKVLQQAVDLEPEYTGRPDLILRLAGLLHDIGKPRTRRFGENGKVMFYNHDAYGAKLTKQILTRLRFDSVTVNQVAELVRLHMRFYGYMDAGWSDAGVRRYVHDAGELLPRLHALTRADVTTQNKRLSDRLSFAYDDLEQRIVKLREQEELDSIRPVLNGDEIMEILHLKPSKQVGEAYKFLLDRRMELGVETKDEAKKALLEWNSAISNE